MVLKQILREIARITAILFIVVCPAYHPTALDPNRASSNGREKIAKELDKPTQTPRYSTANFHQLLSLVIFITTKIEKLFANGKKSVHLHDIEETPMAENMHAFDPTALRERYNPDGSALRRDQLELLDMLRRVAEICERNNIRWWLSSGTLLGAARHKGFIPWDDDIDIVMLRKDYRRLERILRQEQNSEFVLHSMHSDVEYISCFAKYRKRAGRIESASRRYNYYKWCGIGIGFDIFTIEKTNFLAAKAASTIYGNTQHLTSYIRWGWLRKPLIRLIELLCLGLIFPILRLIGLINPKGEYHYSLGSGWAKHTFYMRDTLPLTTIEFEGYRFPAPKDVDAYLTNVYGDWHKLPNEQTIKRSIHCKEYINEIYGEQK